jgi:hypothetical protein
MIRMFTRKKEVIGYTLESRDSSSICQFMRSLAVLSFIVSSHDSRYHVPESVMSANYVIAKLPFYISRDSLGPAGTRRSCK